MGVSPAGNSKRSHALIHALNVQLLSKIHTKDIEWRLSGNWKPEDGSSWSSCCHLFGAEQVADAVAYHCWWKYRVCTWWIRRNDSWLSGGAFYLGESDMIRWTMAQWRGPFSTVRGHLLSPGIRKHFNWLKLKITSITKTFPCRIVAWIQLIASTILFIISTLLVNNLYTWIPTSDTV